MELENLLYFLGMIASVGSGWLGYGSTFKVIRLSDSCKFSKLIRLFMWIDDPTRWGVTFWTQEFGIENSKLFVFY